MYVCLSVLGLVCGGFLLLQLLIPFISFYFKKNMNRIMVVTVTEQHFNISTL